MVPYVPDLVLDTRITMMLPCARDGDRQTRQVITSQMRRPVMRVNKSRHRVPGTSEDTPTQPQPLREDTEGGEVGMR